jgi:hypothetical protein
VSSSQEQPNLLPILRRQECLRAISGHSADILRIFDLLESCGIINPPADKEHETGGGIRNNNNI